jgi:farnesyl-diphosphate farnesyltransferase
MGALSRPEEVLALVKLRVAAGQIKRQIPPEEHWAFGYSMLQKVSRSFALVIQQLPPQLRNAVSTNSIRLSPFFFDHSTRIRLRL